VLTEETALYTVEFFADLGEIDVDPAAINLEDYFNFDLLANAVQELGER
jgi:hypothetical protein